MADNDTIKDGGGNDVTVATDALADGSKSPKVSILDGSGSPTPISPATSAGQATGNTSLASLVSAVGEVQGSPTSNTILDRLKALLTGTVLAAGSAIIGKVGIDQTTPGTTDSVSVKSQGYWATATFTPAAAAYSANDIMDVAKTFTWVDKNGNTFGGGALIITSAELVISESAIQSGETSYTLQKFSAARAVPLADNAASDVAVADANIYQHRTDIGSPVDRGAILSVKANSINEQIMVPATGVTIGELVTNGGFTATATTRKVTLHSVAV